MDIYHYDRETGAYLRPGVADRDPRSPARFIIPANATTVAPPPAEEHSVRVFRDGVWGYVPSEDPEAEPSPEPAPVDLAAYGAHRRWFTETSGCRFNNWPVKTDAESQAKITAERLAVEAGVRLDTDLWKFADGEFRVLTNEEMTGLSNTVREHVRNCFAREGWVQLAIANGDITTTAEIDEAFADFSAPWPSDLDMQD